jgi:hypothetical protein
MVSIFNIPFKLIFVKGDPAQYIFSLTRVDILHEGLTSPFTAQARSENLLPPLTSIEISYDKKHS